MNRVEFQSAAEADLVEVWLRIAADSIERADEYIFHLHEICELIAEQPAMGVARPDIAAGVRSFPVGNFTIFYECSEKTVSVLRVWHASRDPLTLGIL